LTESLANFRELVETTIDLKAADAHEYRIKPDFDATLQSIRQSMDDTVEQMNHQHDKVLSQLGLEGDKKLKFEKSPIYGYHFRLTRTVNFRESFDRLCRMLI
jgi:DNA mismatch repair protein MSH2